MFFVNRVLRQTWQTYLRKANQQIYQRKMTWGNIFSLEIILLLWKMYVRRRHLKRLYQMFMIPQRKVSWHSYPISFFFSKCCIASNKLLHIRDLQVHRGMSWNGCVCSRRTSGKTSCGSTIHSDLHGQHHGHAPEPWGLCLVTVWWEEQRLELVGWQRESNQIRSSLADLTETDISSGASSELILDKSHLEKTYAEKNHQPPHRRNK